MKVAMWYNNRDIRIEDQPLPRPGPAEMLLKVASCGICGSDIVEWYRLPRAPLVQGHELGAKVVETGAEVTRFRPGDRVFVAPKVACLECKYCREGHFPQCAGVKERLPGGFAEYVLVPPILLERGTYLLPDSISFGSGTGWQIACIDAGIVNLFLAILDTNRNLSARISSVASARSSSPSHALRSSILSQPKV